MIEMWALASLILIAGMVDDLRSSKVHNPLIVGAFGLSLIASFYFRGIDGTLAGSTALLLALVMTIPLFTMGMLGGGDVKLFAVFALCVEPTSMFWTLVYSMVWGALFGLTRAALQKQLMSVVRNTYRISGRQKVESQQLHKIPYTFALVLGWFTQLTFLHAGGVL